MAMWADKKRICCSCIGFESLAIRLIYPIRSVSDRPVSDGSDIYYLQQGATP